MGVDGEGDPDVSHYDLQVAVVATHSASFFPLSTGEVAVHTGAKGQSAGSTKPRAHHLLPLQVHHMPSQNKGCGSQEERGAQHPAAHLSTECPALTHMHRHRGTGGCGGCS